MLPVLTAADDPTLRPWHLSVDGMSPEGPNLSHWPGNRTPADLKADLSTGICLRFARASEAARAALLAGATQVLNDHYDTDGFLSLLAVTRPEVALAREEVCLAAAATGDYGIFVTPRAFAIDRIVLNLGKRPGTPLYGQLEGSLPQRNHRRYLWLLDHADEVLDRPEALAPLYADELSAVLTALDAARTGALRRSLFHAEGLSVLESDTPVPRMVLNTLAFLHRVLHVQAAGSQGRLYRLHERTESWFDMVTISPPARRDLRPIAARLQDLEGGLTTVGAARWNADAPTEPIPELYYGVPAAQAYGEVTRALAPSRLPPARVIEELRAYFR
ncbi:MAG: DUF6687 family protein [Planctomycetota bacterium]